MESSPYNHLRTQVHYYSYNVTEYPFYSQIQKIYNITEPLEKIHLLNVASIDGPTTFDNDTKTDYHKMYYKSSYYQSVISIYNNFIRNVICPMFPEDIVVQKEPSYRIGIPNNTVLGRLANDDDQIIGLHCDGDYNHPPEEVNFMLSITGQENTNSCYIETAPMKGDFFPLKIEKGQFVSFYGNRCRHYSKINVSDQTRISFDFRVIPFSEYKEYDASAIHSGRKFSLGEYYMMYKK